MVGQKEHGGLRCGARARSRLLLAALRSALALALVPAGWPLPSPAAQASEVPVPAATQGPGPVWLCQPGQAETTDPCAYSLAAAAVTAAGTLKPATWPRSATASQFDCFYVHPTDSTASTANTGTALTTPELVVAVEQAAPLSQVCQVWAPSYDSQTWRSVEEGLAGNETEMRSTFTVAYNSVLSDWDWFLAHSGGKPVVLVGDSQGSAVLIHLISAELDHEPSVLRRVLVAVLVGGNLQVPFGKAVGATLTKVPLCTSATETGCAIAFSSYPSQPPADSVFGRPGQGVSLQSGQTAKAGQQVACVNPAALAGGTADLGPYLLTATQVGLSERVTTPWVTYPGLYSARCEQGGGATWLQVTSLAGKSHTRPVVNDNAVGAATGAAWGYHGYEYGLTLGNLLQDIAGEEAAWESRH
jgi:pimeloyl-ACP methyl ester carboxylesterase